MGLGIARGNDVLKVLRPLTIDLYISTCSILDSLKSFGSSATPDAGDSVVYVLAVNQDVSGGVGALQKSTCLCGELVHRNVDGCGHGLSVKRPFRGGNSIYARPVLWACSWAW